MRELSKSFLRDKSGNFATLFGVFSVAIVMAVGFAIDFTRLVGVKDNLQNIADAAALAGAHVALDETGTDARTLTVNEALATSGLSEIGNYTGHEPYISFDDEREVVQVHLSGKLDTFLIGALGINMFEPKVKASSLIRGSRLRLYLLHLC